MNIKEISLLIDQKSKEIMECWQSASAESWTVESLSHELALKEKTNVIGDAFDNIDKLTQEIFELKQLRNKLNMETKTIFKGVEYSLIDLVELIKIKKNALENMGTLVAPRTKQTVKRLDSTIGKTVVKEFNGNVEELKARIKELELDIDTLQAQIDMLNLSTNS